MQWLLKQIFLDCFFFIGTNNFFISVLFHWYFTSLTSFILTLAHNKVIKHAQLLLNYLSQNLNWNSTGNNNCSSIGTNRTRRQSKFTICPNWFCTTVTTNAHIMFLFHIKKNVLSLARKLKQPWLKQTTSYFNFLLKKN